MNLFFYKLFSTTWPATLWSALIFILLATPGNSLPPEHLFGIPQLDKVVHAFLFFVFTWLWAKSIATFKFKRSIRNRIVLIALLATFYGIALEFVQLYVGRDFDLWDMVADAVGAFLYVLLYKKIGPGKNRGRNQN